MLMQQGHKVFWLGRQKNVHETIPSFYWDPEKNYIDEKALEKADRIIHLAGMSINQRWTKKNKQQIIDSRVKTARMIFDALSRMGKHPEAFISASAAGYYGTYTSDKIFTETDKPANDFTGTVCRLWEEQARLFSTAGIRTVILRSGVVLSTRGGALQKMMVPVKAGFGVPAGTGKQYFPWIHIDDLCRLYIKAIEDRSMEGPYNAVAPEHLTNAEFMRALCRVMKKPFRQFSVPPLLMKLFFGEMSVLLLEGSRLSCRKAIETGFTFEFPDIDTALTDLLAEKK